MPTKRTQVWAAQDALLQALQAQTWDEPIKPVLGTPARMEADQVWVSGEVDQWSAQYRTSGLGTKDEVFTLRVHCLATRLGGGYTELRDRLAALGANVEDVLQDDFTLGGTVMLATIASQQVEEAMLDDGRRRQGLLTFFIECTAHVAG
mgnify:CR=1 FL=1